MQYITIIIITGAVKRVFSSDLMKESERKKWVKCVEEDAQSQN